MDNRTGIEETSPTPLEDTEAAHPDLTLKTVHLSLRRYPIYQTKTEIFEDSAGNRIVRKTPLYPEGIPFLSKSISLIPALRSEFEPLGLRIANHSWNGHQMEIEYVQGQPLSERLADSASQGNISLFTDLFRRYVELIRASGSMKFEMNDAFTSVFGKVKLPSELKSARVTNIDLIPQNILISQNSEWTMIDPEWTFAFPIPVDFVLYRAIFYLRDAYPTLRQSLTSKEIDLWTLSGIRAERARYLRMEETFQSETVGLHAKQNTETETESTRPVGFAARLKKSALDLAMKTPLKWRFLERNAFRD